MNKTGVFATPEELEALRRLVSGTWRPGDMMIVFSIAEGIKKDQRTVDAKKACHACALKHSLPEIVGYYGIEQNGEFVTFETVRKEPANGTSEPETVERTE